MFMNSSVVRDPSRRARFAAIGAVTVASSTLELETMDLYAALLHSPFGMLIASGMGFDQLQQGCVALVAQDQLSPIREEVTTLMATGKALYDQRSGVVHGLWAFTDHGDDTEPLPTLRFRRHGKVLGTEWPNEDMMDLAECLLDAAADVESITARLRATQREAGDPQ